MKMIYLTAFLLASMGALFSGIAYFAPFGNTGVDGSLGALLTLIGAVSSAAGLLIILTTKITGSLLSALSVLIILAAILTALAAYFLLQFVVVLAMAATLVALVMAIALPENRRITQ
ncbi:MAG: hypothetical protein ACK4N1_15810 [Pseudorhizobium sp.]